MYKLEGYFGYGIYLYFVYLLRYKVYYLWVSPNNEKWAVS